MATHSIIIPAYNEQDRISETIRTLESNMPEIGEIIVVFDGTDNTPKVARSAGKKVKVLEFPERLGKGGAIIEGIKHASGDVICFTDADGSSPWYEIKRICSTVSTEYPVVVGSRWMRSSEVIKPEPLFNRLAGRMFHYLVFTFLGIKVKDTQCGLKAFRREVIKSLTERIKITNRTFDVALLFHLKKLGIIPLEVGIEWSHNENTRMPILKVIPMMFMTIIGLRLVHRPKTSKRTKKTLEDLYHSFGFY